MERHTMGVSKYVTLTELAEEAGLHPNTVRRRVWDGTVPAYRIGTHYRFILDEALPALLRPVVFPGSPAARPGPVATELQTVAELRAVRLRGNASGSR